MSESSSFASAYRSVLSSLAPSTSFTFPSDLCSLLALHQLVSAVRLRSSPPLSLHLCSLSSSSSLPADLARLLSSSPHLRALFSVHDDVANRRYLPLLPAIPHEVDEDEGVAVKVVRLVKQHEPLGATIKCDKDGVVVIARVIRGGVADRTGCIQVGDRVIEVNGVPVAGTDPANIVRLLAASNGTVTFKLIPADDFSLGAAAVDALTDGSMSATLQDEARPRVRAQFDYIPLDDPLHPCPEAGLEFHKGDILELVEADDDHWWQTRNEGGVLRSSSATLDGRVGLVPSRLLQEKRAAVSGKKTDADDGQNTWDSRKSAKSGATHVRKIVYDTAQADELDGGQLRSYEDMALLYPRPQYVRPVVLIGPSGVGRNELKRRLLMLNPDRFGTTIPHTSRPQRAHETDGVDYHFASRTDMEQWVRQGAFLEYGEYRGNLYGTLASSVRALIEQQRIPVLNPHPQALRLLRTADFKPFIIYVKPPPFSVLKETRSVCRARSGGEGSYQRGFTDEELQQMLATAHGLERQYGHWIDCELLNGNVEFAFRELCAVLQRVESEPCWVPASWLR